MKLGLTCLPDTVDPRGPKKCPSFTRSRWGRWPPLRDWLAKMETVRPEDALRAARISTKRQAQYQRRMSSLLAGR